MTTAAQAGAAAETADARKVEKYSSLPKEFTFQPIAFESLGAASSSTSSFLSLLGHRMCEVSGDPREVFHLRQRSAVCLQRYNAILLAQSFVEPQDGPD